jgi:hypothetical protein
MFDDAEIEIPCPGCEYKTKKAISWIKANDAFVCSGCGATVRLNRDKLLGGLGKLDQSIDDLKRKRRDIGKGFKL